MVYPKQGFTQLSTSCTEVINLYMFPRSVYDRSNKVIYIGYFITTNSNAYVVSFETSIDFPKKGTFTHKIISPPEDPIFNLSAEKT